MALKPCRECKSMVSDEAKACQNCGIQKPVKRSAKWLWITFGVVVLFIVISPKNKNSTDSASIQSPEPNAEQAARILERGARKLEVALQDPRKARLMECIGVNPWEVRPADWTPPTEVECDQLKQVLGAEADARERSSSKN